MFIDATTSDLQGFDPSKSGNTLPPVGAYSAIEIKVIFSEQSQSNAGHNKFDITYEAINGQIAGQQFKLSYNVGHSNPDTAKWAVQDVLRIIYGITGDKNIGRVNFDEKMYFRPFNATLTITEKPGKDKDGNTIDGQGNPITWKNGKLTAIKPLNEAGAPQQAAHAGQPQQGQQPAGQPQAGGSPSWHNK